MHMIIMDEINDNVMMMIMPDTYMILILDNKNWMVDDRLVDDRKQSSNPP